MRIGQNPAKQIFEVAQPRALSIAVVTDSRFFLRTVWYSNC